MIYEDKDEITKVNVKLVSDDVWLTKYFRELLQRIRDIRSSERNFYQLVTGIYITSID